MKEKLIEEMKSFQASLESIDANYKNLFQKNYVHDKHLETLRQIELILTDIRQRIDRFYSKDFQYVKELETLAGFLNEFKSFYGENSLTGGLSMEDCKLRVIGILGGIIKELEEYDIPSCNDPKFDKIN